MDHKVRSVQELYDDAKKLYDEVVLRKGDTIINNLSQAIQILKNSWEGQDAGIQIQNIIEIYNAMTKIRNALAILARDSTAVASKYRDIQVAGRADLSVLTPITIDTERILLEPYEDRRDTINITNEATNGKAILDAINNQYDDFKSDARKYYDLIMENWQSGIGRNSAEETFSEFMLNADRYKSKLEEVSISLANALRNYQN